MSYLAPFYSDLPDFTPECSGYTLGAIPYGCITGELRYIGYLGNVRAEYLRPTVLEVPVPVTEVSAPLTTVSVLVVNSETVAQNFPVTVTPEPHTFFLLAALILVVIFRRKLLDFFDVL